MLGCFCGTVLMAAACGARPDVEAVNDLDEEYDVPARRSRLTLEDLPPMPEYPDSVDGHVVVVSAGDFPIDGQWRAGASICPLVGIIELYTDDLQNGMGMLLYFPDSQAAGRYALLPPDSGIVLERTARIGVQVFRESRNDAFGFHAIEGQVEISEAGGHLSGKFQATLEETQIEILTRYVGALYRIPLGQMPDDYCAGLRDSLLTPAAAADTAAADPMDGAPGS